MNKSVCVLLLVLMVLAGSAVIPGCTRQQEQEKTALLVIPAGSLLVPFETIEEGFEELHPDVDVLVEGHGSIQAVRQVTDLHREADVVAVADESLIPDMMYIPMEDGTGNYADTYTAFATNEMVVAYTKKSLYTEEINASNWYGVLMRPDVRVGISNPMLDAAGYRAFMVCALAEQYYADDRIFNEIIGDHVAGGVDVSEGAGGMTVTLPELVKPSSDKLAIRDGSIYLLALLDAGGIDYAFEYRSVAEEHGLEWIDLPSEVDLSTVELAESYGGVHVQLGFDRFASIGSVRTGRPIVYGITVPNNAPHPQLAEEFVAFVVSEFEKGRADWPEPV
jgi:molybdate/tungstate transport system substrate-binding protein